MGYSYNGNTLHCLCKARGSIPLYLIIVGDGKCRHDSDSVWHNSRNVMTVDSIKPHYVRCKSLPNNYGAMQVTGKTVKVHELLNEVKILTAKIFILN